MTTEHHCHAIDCQVRVPPKLLMCLHHWRLVPRALQAEVWRCYRPGQERTKNPTIEYLIAARRAVHAVALLEGRMTQEQADAAMARLEALL